MVLESWRSLLSSLSAVQAAMVRSHGGIGAGAWLNPPTRSEHKMDDDSFIVSIRRRLLFVDPAAMQGCTCQHPYNDGRRGVCNATVGDDLGSHSISCPVGPGRVKRHDSIRDALADWLAELHGRDAVTIEQHIPAWDRTTTEGIQLAVLDVVVTRPAGRVAIDVSVADISAEGARAQTRARASGVAARARELEKHRRYPGPGLVAAVLETGGLCGKEFHAFLRSQAATDPLTRGHQLRDVRQRLAVALQQGNAAMMLSAALAQRRPWQSGVQGVGGRGVRRKRAAMGH